MEVLSFTDIELDPGSVAQRLRVSDKELARRLIDSAKCCDRSQSCIPNQLPG